MHNKFKREMFKTRERENVYIVEKIVKNLDKFVLFLAMRYNFASLINNNIVFFKCKQCF